ncbi:MAG: hypothetical protein CMH35_01885 [Microbacterium sp.]|nr:hypothetical protein [Microbacterium sp.]
MAPSPRPAKEADPDTGDAPEPPRPVNWNILTAAEAQVEWLELNAWVNWLRHEFGLSVNVVPPYWHRHPELVWPLSALRQHYLNAYDKKQHGSAPFGWWRDFWAFIPQLRDAVTACGTKLNTDRPTRQAVWPGEDDLPPVTETIIPNRDADFTQFVKEDVARRQAIEDEFYARLAAEQ